MERKGKAIYKGQIVHTPTIDGFEIIENGYIVVNEDGKVENVYKELPLEYRYHSINNYGNKLIIPGFVDLHVHSGQYENRGLCLDLPLLDWLFECTFPLELKYKDLGYAKEAYGCFIRSLWRSGNLRSVLYDTIFTDSVKLLMDMLISSGMCAYVGRANMDENAPDYLLEDTEESLKETERFILETKDISSLVKPAIYPRFIPTSSSKLLWGLCKLAKKYNVPVISHLSESINEVEITQKMYPGFSSYAAIYDYYGLLGQTPTVMAHAVYSERHERELLKRRGVWVAHSPLSNFNLGSGLMASRLFIKEGIKLGLGSDIGASADISISKSMYAAITTSKLVWLYSGDRLEPLKAHEAFYLGTKGGGSFFGKVGSFEPGYEFDALVIDDSKLLDLYYTVEQRIQRFIYIGEDDFIIARYISGRFVPEPQF